MVQKNKRKRKKKEKKEVKNKKRCEENWKEKKSVFLKAERIWKKIKNNLWIVHFIKYIVMGVSATILNMIIYSIALKSVNYMWSAIIAFIISNIYAFLITKHWVFEETRHLYRGHKMLLQYIVFLVVSLIGLGVNLYFLNQFIKIGIDKYSSQLISLFIAFLVRFTLNKYFTFKKWR